MNFKITFTWTLALTAFLFLAACEKEAFIPTDEDPAISQSFESELLAKSKKEDKDRGKPGSGSNDDGSDDAITYAGTYQIVTPINDPLYRFSFSTDGDLVLLESNPAFGNFGSDYFGFWADPFTVADNQATWVQGLNTYIWTFDRLTDTQVNVTETHIQRPYLNGETTTTVTDLGLYELLP